MSGRRGQAFLFIGRVVWRRLGAYPLTTAIVSLLRNIATIAVFYALPVVQLVITYQTVSSRAGSLGPGGCALPGLCAHHRPRPTIQAGLLE